MKFIDYVEIEVQAGRGGHGCIAFHTEKFMPRGGPSGGDGGRGGDIIARADSQLTTLLDFRYRKTYKAANGLPGSGSNKTGRNGEATVLNVPVGTLIRDRDNDHVVADLDSPGVETVVAAGGKGGHGNHYYKSATNQAPRKAQDGWPGEHRRLALELKLLADVGLVGLPNAGKSTILASFSAARPKIADYPFTTLVPNLGIVKLREYKSCVMADIPGLIEGAAEGKGLGHQFLKHIQRTRLLIYVIDINEPEITATRELLERELAQFDPELPRRPSFTVVTKVDTVASDQRKEMLAGVSPDYLPISAVSRENADQFLQRIEAYLDRLRDAATTR